MKDMTLIKSLIATTTDFNIQTEPIYYEPIKYFLTRDFINELEYKSFEYKTDNEPLECCSAQYVDVNVSMNDILPYMSENETLKLKTYMNETDWYKISPNPEFSNFEYWAKYNWLSFGNEFSKKILDYKTHNFKLCLMDIESKQDDLPSFIRNYKQIDNHYKFYVDIKNKGICNIINNDKIICKYGQTVMCMCNLPYEFYSQYEIRPCVLHYNIDKNKFISSMKETPIIENLCKNINENGLSIPLILKINRYGTITQLINCNSRYITSRYLKLPFVPAILLYNGCKDISSYINGYTIKNDFCSNWLRINISEYYKEITNG